MRERLELLVNLWTFGAPAVLLTWGLLRLCAKAPARARYALAIAAFAATLWSAAVPAAGPAASRRLLILADYAAAPVTITWFAVAALLLLREAHGHLRLRRTRRALRDAAWLHDLDTTAPLAVSDRAAPFTIGLLRPVVVLPADLHERFPREIVERIVRHERSHARWRDPLVFAVLRIVAILFWPSPAWLVLRWVRREREAAADAAALDGTRGAEQSYVAALLRLARPAHALAADMAASDLEYRVRCLLAPRGSPLRAIAALLAGTLLLSIAAPANLDAGSPSIHRHVIVR